MVSNRVDRTQGWQGKLLSVGGRVVLIRPVLYFIPLHIISVVHPPKSILHHIEKSLANIFGVPMKARENITSFLGKKLCFPKLEGGLGLDHCMTFASHFHPKLVGILALRNLFLP